MNADELRGGGMAGGFRHSAARELIFGPTAKLTYVRGLIALGLSVVAHGFCWMIARGGQGFATQYEMVGSMLIVGLVGLLAGLPLFLTWAALAKWSGRTAGLAVFESGTATILNAVLVWGGVMWLVPLEQWDRYWVTFSALIGMAAVLSVLGALGIQKALLGTMARA